MSYQANINAGGPQPVYPQQTGYSMNQTTFDKIGAPHTAEYVPPNHPQYAPHHQQQGSPYIHPTAPGGQYPPSLQQNSQQQYGVSPQPMTVTQPQVYNPPQVVVVGCPQGQHYYTNHFGACGIIAAVLLFPIGFIFLFLDQERRCDRCGARG